MMYRLILCSILTVFLSSNVFASHSSASVDRASPKAMEGGISLDYNEVLHPENDYILLAGGKSSKKPPKNAKVKKTLKQKLSFKRTKRSLSEAKVPAKLTLTQAISNQKIAFKNVQQAWDNQAAAKAQLNAKKTILTNAKANAAAKTGLSGLIAKSRVKRMEKSVDKADMKYKSGPVLARQNASLSYTAANRAVGKATQDLNRVREPLVVRKSKPNNTNYSNIGLVSQKKLSNQSARGLQPVAGYILAPQPASPGLPPPRPPRPQQFNQGAGGLQPVAGYSLAPRPASPGLPPPLPPRPPNTIYGPGPAQKAPPRR